MKIRSYLAALLTVLLVSVPAWSNEQGFAFGLYVVVDDMDESRKFYERLFESEPYVDNGDFVGFSLSGDLFALFASRSFEHVLSRGNGVVPYIRVADIHKEFERVKSFAPEMVHSEVVTEGPISLFMFKDPSGNPIEFYSLIAPQ